MRGIYPLKIDYHLYELKGRNRFKDRQGALLKFTFSDEMIGYADCHPWEELGDASLGSQLTLLREGVNTPLTARSASWARIDAQARVENMSLFSGLRIPESHWLFTGDLKELDHLEEFSRMKVKVQSLDESDLLLRVFSDLPENIRLRIDCNEKLSPESFGSLLNSINEYRDRIEYFEDPMPYDSKIWKQYAIPLACDRDAEKAIGEDIICVIKPALQDPQLFLSHPKRMVTTYLDHPLGQMAAAFAAAQLPDKNAVCGLLSHKVYQTNEFSERLINRGPYLQEPEGTGFGFDDLLEAISWRVLA